MDSTQGLFIDGSTKRPGESSESLELSAMGNSGQCGKTAKKGKFEPYSRINKQIYYKIKKMFETYIYSPPQTITQSQAWIDDPEAELISPRHEEFKLALNNWQTKLSHMTYEDFQNFYRPQRHYTWRRGSAYHPVPKSFQLAKQWLEEQCRVGSYNVHNGFNYEKRTLNPQIFMQLIANCVCRREKKKFAIVFQGPNSCGKTWFTNMFLDYFINKGEMNNWNRHENSNFPFMGLVNRRIALWNEGGLNGDASQLEHLKVLLEGESKTVGVKCQPDGTVLQTPFIITTNNYMFEKNIAFKDRCTIVNIDKVPMLRGGPECPGRMSLHPFAFSMLINHYNIETNEDTSDRSNEITSLSEFMHFEDPCIDVQ